ncbi:hypothetical protein Dimus_004982 [Dionaea muscipula]
MSTSSRSDSGDSTFDVDELIHLGARSRELAKEKVMLKGSQSQGFELIKRLELHFKGLNEANGEDKKQIQGLERQLLKCYMEIDHLQDQLNVRNVEVDCLEENASSLKLKLANMTVLQEEILNLKEELKRSYSERLFLKQELASKEVEVQKYKLCIDELEESISSSALESQCEIESMRLEMMNLEQSCFVAKKCEEEFNQEKALMKELISKLDVQIGDAKDTIDTLEKENEDLKAMLNLSTPDTLLFRERIQKHLEGPDAEIKNHIEKMSRQIYEYELLVEELKRELREQKSKAKEEGEELAQEMAELRYQMMELLEEERKRRACIELASLQRIAELEAQIRIGHRKSSVPSSNTRDE